jgi:hypothetical protein
MNTGYSSEQILLNQLRDPTSSAYKNYVTLNPEEADFFFIPFLGARYLTFCWYTLSRRDDDCEVDAKYFFPMMNYIQQKLPFWNRSMGWDHIMVHPMDRTDTYYKLPELMRNATYLTTIGDKRLIGSKLLGARRNKNIVIPSATNILNQAKIDPLKYLNEDGRPKNTKRDIFAIFGGIYEDVKPTEDYSAGIRSLFKGGFDKSPGYKLSAGWGFEEYATLLSRSRYGLAPMGWTLDTTRLWEYLAFGVVPVIISDGIVEPFEDDIDWNSFSIRIPRKEAHRMDEILRAIPFEKYQELQRRTWEYGRRVLLTEDAWHLIARDLCRRINWKTSGLSVDYNLIIN